MPKGTQRRSTEIYCDDFHLDSNRPSARHSDWAGSGIFGGFVIVRDDQAAHIDVTEGFLREHRDAMEEFLKDRLAPALLYLAPRKTTPGELV
jgi:hypothetical protein